MLFSRKFQARLFFLFFTMIWWPIGYLKRTVWYKFIKNKYFVVDMSFDCKYTGLYRRSLVLTALCFGFLNHKFRNIFLLHPVWCLKQIDSELKTESNEWISFQKYDCPKLEKVSHELGFLSQISRSALHAFSIRKTVCPNAVPIRTFTLYIATYAM